MTTAGAAVAGLAAARALGPLFAVELVGSQPPGPGWRSVADLIEDPEGLSERVGSVRLQLGHGTAGGSPAVEERTAASLTALGLAARLVAPVLGAAALVGAVPVGGPTRWYVGRPGPGPPAVLVRPGDAIPCQSDGELAAALAQHCLEPVVEPLVYAIGTLCSVSTQVLRGNVASAVAGAARAAMRARPDLAPRLGPEVAALFAGGLRDSGSWARPDPRRDRWFLVRRSCCLLHRLPGAPLCGDCVLLPAATRRVQWAAELVPRCGTAGPGSDPE
jgi:hypothetical protein